MVKMVGDHVLVSGGACLPGVEWPTDRTGDLVLIGSGAVGHRQGEGPVYSCSLCGQDLDWATDCECWWAIHCARCGKAARRVDDFLSFPCVGEDREWHHSWLREALLAILAGK